MNRSHLSGGDFRCCCGDSGGGSGTSTTTTILISRAESLTGTSGLEIFEDHFVVVPGTRGSYWRDLHATDVHIVNDVPGGVVQIASNTGYGAVVVDPYDGYPAIPADGPSFIGNVSAANPFYMAVRFQLAPEPGGGGPGGWDESHCSFVIGLVDPNNLKVIGIGLDVGAGFFSAVNGQLNTVNNLDGLPSLVARDLDVWHWAELYTTPTSSKWWLKIDDGVPIDVTALFPDGAVLGTPVIQIMTDDVLQPAVNVDHILFGTRAADATPLPALGASASLPSGATDVGLAVLRAASQAAGRTALNAQGHSPTLDAIIAAIGPTGLALLGAMDGPDAGNIIDPKVQAFALLAGAADKLPYLTGAGSMDVADFPAQARALLAETTQAGQRSALGLVDLTDEASGELANAVANCGFTYPSKLWTADALAKIGTLGSKWTPLIGGTGAVSIVQTGERGGVNEITTGGTGSSSVQLISCINGLASYGAALMNDLTASDSKWHVQFDFKLTAAVDNVTELGMGWISPGGSPGPLLGVRGHQSTSFFRLFIMGSSTGVDSTRPVDINVWHRARMWAGGDGKIYASIDNETPMELSGYTYGTEATPFASFSNNATGAARKWRTGSAHYRVDGNT